jgi:hypothetical protein
MPSESQRLPFDEVNQTDARKVAPLLGLVQVKRQPRKFPCIGASCASSDALHAYPGGGFYCFSCKRWWSNVDAGMTIWGCLAVEACAWLAALLGYGYLVPEWARRRLEEAAPPATAKRAPAPKPRTATPDDGLVALRALGMVPALAPTIYTAIVAEVLTLTEAGADYLRSRALDPEQAAAYGFRALDGPADWQRLDAQLSESFLDTELAAAGFPKVTWRGRLLRWLPWDGIPPALVLPSPVGAEITALRFRRLDSSAPKADRYRSLIGQPITRPWNADALRGCEGAEVHVCEGELDALALVQRGYRAVALCGATPADELLEALARRVGGLGRLIYWRDGDEAGLEAMRRLWGTLQRAHGAAWMREHVEGRRLVGVKDLGELFASGGTI